MTRRQVIQDQFILLYRNGARRVVSPLKSASRRPDDKGWTPWMAARGESRQDVELSRPQAAGREVSAVRSTDFIAGPRGWIRGPRWPPYLVHRLRAYYVLRYL